MANSNVSFEVEGTTLLPGGDKLVRGWVAIGYPDEYDSTNTWFDLSNHLKASGHATVAVMSQTGYRITYEGGQADGGRLVARFVDNANVNKEGNTPMVVCENALNVATNCLFIAIGRAY